MSKPKQILKISNSFHVFNFTPTSPKPNTIVGSREEQFIQGGFVRTRDASGCLENSTYIYTAITVLTHPIKLYYHILHLTWSLHTSKLFHQTLLSCLTKAPTCELPVCEEHRFGLLSTEIH